MNEWSDYCRMSRQDLCQRVSGQMSQKRWDHCLRVEAKAIALAQRHGLDPLPAQIAALVHDYAKEMPLEDLRRLAKEAGLAEEYLEESSEILHGPIAAYLLPRDFGIQDQELLLAVCQHTIGGIEMTPLAKCLFVADAVEDGRSYPGVEEARALADQDLDQAVWYLVKSTLQHLIQKQVPIFLETIRVYNYLARKQGV